MYGKDNGFLHSRDVSKLPYLQPEGTSVIVV